MRTVVQSPPLSAGRLRLAIAAIAMGTFVSVLNNSIINVPLREIARDYGVSIGEASLITTCVNITFGGLMPLMGWLGNRIGRRTAYVLGNVGLLVAGLASVFAPNLPALIVFRIVQGACASAITPTVIAILAELAPPLQRPRALATWAAANGLGQALGPPLGGILAGAFGWRMVLVVPALLAGLTVIGALRYIPADAGQAVPLERRGAFGLTVFGLAILSALALVPEIGNPPVAWLGALLLAVSAAGGTLFLRSTRTAAAPFVAPAVFSDPSYVRSCIVIACGVISLGAAVIAIPLYLTRELGLTLAQAGGITFVLPLGMVLSAPLVARVVRQTSAAAGMRVGLGVLAGVGVALALTLPLPLGVVPLLPLVFASGMGVAFVQTSCAVGSTTTAASRYGAGVGLFTLFRVIGAVAGTAWAALVLRTWPDAFALVFGGLAVAAVAGSLATFSARRHVPR